MSGEVTTLAGALSLDRATVERMLAVAGVKEKLGEVPARMLGGVLDSVRDQVLSRVHLVLDVPLPTLLAGAWSRCMDLRKFCDPKAHPPDEVSVVTLAKHTVRSVHRPHVAVEVTGGPVPVRLRMDFEVGFWAEVEAARLTIQAARLRRLLRGTLAYGVKLSFQGRELRETNGTFTLPGEFSFGEGIPILPTIRVEKPVEPAAGAVADR
ncbi:MAG TPA: hypothetical protein VF746_05255 [Longimicrobium sp.]|jgi:hypothetical protein